MQRGGGWSQCFSWCCVTENKGVGGGGGGWGGGELYYVKGSNVNVKKIIKPFLYHCEEIEISLI